MTHAINRYNSLFYSKTQHPFSESGLADFFTNTRFIQEALKTFIEKNIDKKNIKILELGCGSDLSRWKTIISLPSTKNWEVTLTDFSKKILPDVTTLQSKNFSFQTSEIDLLKPLCKQVENTFDVVLSTYTFDSVWGKEDIHLEKRGKTWSYALYDLEVIPKYRRTFSLNDSKKTKYEIKDFEKIAITKQLLPLNIMHFKYGKIIHEYYKQKTFVNINFPGNLIEKIDEFFAKSINRNGLFITGDIAVVEKTGKTTKRYSTDTVFGMDDYMTSGKVAKFKIEDYGLAKVILEEKGYKVDLMYLEEFLKKNGQKIPFPLSDHVFLIVRK